MLVEPIRLGRICAAAAFVVFWFVMEGRALQSRRPTLEELLLRTVELHRLQTKPSQSGETGSCSNKMHRKVATLSSPALS
jgi:hypothetical protein